LFVVAVHNGPWKNSLPVGRKNPIRRQFAVEQNEAVSIGWLRKLHKGGFGHRMQAKVVARPSRFKPNVAASEMATEGRLNIAQVEILF